MKPLLTSAIIGLLTCVSCSKDNPGNSKSSCPEQNLVVVSPQQQFINQYIVLLRPDNNIVGQLNGLGQLQKHDQFEQILMGKLALLPGFAGFKPDHVFTNIFQAFSGTFTPEQLSSLQKADWVKTIEPVKSYHAVADCQSASFDLSTTQVVSYGTLKTHSGNGTGKKAWILDSGVDTDHPDLSVNKTLSRNFVGQNVLDAGNTNVEDDNGHGTHVAGIIGAKDNLIGTKGVAAGAEIIAIKVLDANGESSSNSVLLGLDYVFALANPGEVLNISLGGDASTILDIAVQAIGGKGVFVSIAAGNDSRIASSYSPARANGANIYTVSAIDQSNRFAAYSNFGNPPIDYAEPGSSILSTYLDGQYRYLSGTSMSAPHLAGILLLQGTGFTTDGIAFGDPDGNPDPIAVLASASSATVSTRNASYGAPR